MFVHFCIFLYIFVHFCTFCTFCGLYGPMGFQHPNCIFLYILYIFVHCSTFVYTFVHFVQFVYGVCFCTGLWDGIVWRGGWGASGPMRRYVPLVWFWCVESEAYRLASNNIRPLHLMKCTRRPLQGRIHMILCFYPLLGGGRVWPDRSRWCCDAGTTYPLRERICPPHKRT